MISDRAGQMGAAPANRSPSLSNLPCGGLIVGRKAVIDNAVAQIGANNATLSAAIDRAAGTSSRPPAVIPPRTHRPMPFSVLRDQIARHRLLRRVQDRGAGIREGETCGRSVGAILPDPARTQQSKAWRMARVRVIVETAAPAPNRL
jgi:hypothetical protein